MERFPRPPGCRTIAEVTGHRQKAGWYNIVCYEGCASDDNTCSECVSQNVLVCANREGCQADWNCYVECAAYACPSGILTCLGTACPEELDVLGTCLGRVPQCDGSALACLEEL